MFGVFHREGNKLALAARQLRQRRQPVWFQYRSAKYCKINQNKCRKTHHEYIHMHTHCTLSQQAYFKYELSKLLYTPPEFAQQKIPPPSLRSKLQPEMKQMQHNPQHIERSSSSEGLWEHSTRHRIGREKTPWWREMHDAIGEYCSFWHINHGDPRIGGGWSQCETATAGTWRTWAGQDGTRKLR